MTKISGFIAVLALSLGLTSAVLSQKTVKRATPVTTTIAGAGVIADPTVFNYRIQSDLLGPYADGVSSVSSEIQTGGDWRLDTLASTTRTLMFDFRDPVPGSNPNAPFMVANFPGMIETKSYLLYGNGKVAAMAGLNSTLLTPLLMRFDLNGSIHRIWMNSQTYPQTNYAVVTCTGVVDPNNPGTSQCNRWRIEPSVTQPDGQLKNIAKLVRVTTSKGKTTETDLGNFYLSFLIEITNP